MSTLYWDCFAGIAGNMAVASLLDLGADPERLRSELAKLPFPEGGLGLSIRTVLKDGIKATYFNTHDDEAAAHEDPLHDHTLPQPDTHDHTHCHDHGFDLGNRQEYGHTHCHDHDHIDAHAHPHEHDAPLKLDDEHHSQEHPHQHRHSHVLSPERGFREIRELIEAAKYPAGVVDRALACFTALAEAEAEIHGATPDTVHFHEVGARDSIADIVGAALCLDELGITSVHVSPVHVGRGFINCSHGRMPVPAPATALLLRGFEIYSLPEIEGELTTPTGAALLRGLRAKPGMPAGFVPDRIGTGAGSRKFAVPNVLRAFVGKSRPASGGIAYDEILLLETNIDNASGEIMGYVAERLWELGALDVTMTPLIMKKGRPGTAFRVMLPPDLGEQAQTLLFRELPTLGIRRQTVRRAILRRETCDIETPFGTVAGKKIIGPDGKPRFVAEYESLRGKAIETGISLRDIQSSASSHEDHE
ncbi:MAG TPA: nickel pincer cofactor biosynthesis protein LarC [Candidatus Ozemobacteraceae bacterium]|nr:nickel pincer cofactor biosynthesis protein LarC [Candidatus Ozemobacteraceae bacterium]